MIKSFKNLTKYTAITITGYFMLIAAMTNISSIYMLITCIGAFLVFQWGARNLLRLFLIAIDRKDIDRRIVL